MMYTVFILVVIFTIGLLANGKRKKDAEIENFSIDEEEYLFQEDEREYILFLETYIAGVHVPTRKKYILDLCSEGDDLWLKHDKRNRYSKKAIALQDCDYKLIGYIPEIYCDEVMTILDKKHKCTISEIKYDGSYLDIFVKIEVEKEG